MAIRYTPDFNAEIRRVVKNYNAKIRRLNQKGVADTPERAYVSELKEEFSSRAELLRRLRDLQAFSQRGSEEIVQIGDYRTTRYQYEREKASLAAAKRNITREIKEARKDLRSNLSTVYLDNLVARREYLNRPIKSLSVPQIRRWRKIIERESSKTEKEKAFFDNMTRMLFRTAYQSGIDPDKILPVINQLRELTPHQFFIAVQENAEFRDFLDKYQLYVAMDEESDSVYETQLIDSLEYLGERLPEIIKSF